MGNLPNSRTITINNGDPVPANLLNELQDNIIAHNRAAWTRPVWAPISFGAASIVEAGNPAGGSRPPVRKFNAAAGVYFEIQYDEGDTITGLSFEGYGDGAVDVTVNLVYGSGYNIAQLTLSATLTITNAAAAWTTYPLTAFVATLLGTGPLSLVITTNAANFYVGRFLPMFSR